MDDSDLSGFAPPPFNAESALVQLKRSLRDLKLAERGKAYELRGKRVLEVDLDGAVVTARVARTLALTPEWDHVRVANANEQRKLLDDVKKRLARWTQDD